MDMCFHCILCINFRLRFAGQVYGGEFPQHDDALCEAIFGLRHAGGKGVEVLVNLWEAGQVGMLVWSYFLRYITMSHPPCPI